MVWPGRFLALVADTWQAIDIKWTTEESITPNAKDVLQPWSRADTALLVPVWSTELENHVAEDGCWVARAGFTKDSEMSVGWILQKCSELKETVEEIDDADVSWFHNFAVFPTPAFSPRYHFEVQRSEPRS